VLLNITPDHLDRHGTLAAYAAAKLEIFARQGLQDVAVTPADLAERIAWAGAPADVSAAASTSAAPGGATVPGVARRVDFGWDSSATLFELDGELWWQGEPLIALEQMRLRGRHNVENAMAAAAVCLARGVDRQAVCAGLASFPGVAHRLEEIAELEGALYVNDSKATNVASTLVALDAFVGRPVHLILGGRGKGQDFTSLREPVEQACAAVYVIGEDSPTIAAALSNVAPRVLECGDLAHALEAAGKAVQEDRDATSTRALADGSGPVVLLSPACASFDQFADFEARGERFRALVEKLQG
jgi:UDP-N-acetylmuramoylalanine--D-glutamate ligase